MQVRGSRGSLKEAEGHQVWAEVHRSGCIVGVWFGGRESRPIDAKSYILLHSWRLSNKMLSYRRETVLQGAL